MRVAVVTAVWKRHALTEVFWAWTGHLRRWWAPVAEVVCVAAGSRDPVHARLAAEAGAEYVDVPNEPLGRKFNMALKVARGCKADAVLVMGSDDLFCERTAEALGAAFRDPDPYIGLKDLYFYDVADGRMGYNPGYIKPDRVDEPIGCGQIIAAAYLKRLGWELWSSRPGIKRTSILPNGEVRHRRGFQVEKEYQNHGIDHARFRRLKAAVPTPCPLVTVRDLPGTALDLKGCGNLWRWEETNPRALPEGETTDTILGRLPGDLVERIRGFRTAEAVA